MAQRIILKRIFSVQSRRTLYTWQPLSSTSTHINNIQSYPDQAQRRFKSFRSTQPLLSGESKKTEEASDIPDWENPLHHNDPKAEKIMLDDFGSDETPGIVPLPPLDDGSGNTIASPYLHELADEIVTMNMLEVKELVDRIEDYFGLDDGEDFDFGGGAGEAAAEEEVEVKKTAFDLKLTGFDAKSKIKVIKEVRAMTGLGLKEAKEMVEGAPKTIKSDIKMEEAEELKAKLEAVGATVEID